MEVGDCIRFVNIHEIEHSAVALDRTFNTGTLMPRSSSLIRFDTPGEVAILVRAAPPDGRHRYRQAEVVTALSRPVPSHALPTLKPAPHFFLDSANPNGATNASPSVRQISN